MGRHVFSSDRGSAKGPRILTKPSPKWKLLSPKQIKYALSIACARVHAQRKKTYTLFLPTFLVILKPFLTENEKTEAALQIGMAKTQLFHFIIFFSFLVRKTFKIAEMCKKC